MNNASNCTTVREVKPIITMYSVFSVAATLFYVAAIGIIVKKKLHRQFIHRLSVYLALGGLLRAMAIWISVMPVDIQQPDDSNVSVRDGWMGVCSFGGFLNQYTGFIQTFTVVWLAIYIFFGVVYLKQLTQRKYELAGLATIVLAPLLLTWEPLIYTSYGLSTTICWIAVPSCYTQNNAATYYVLLISAIPQIILTQFGLFIMSIAMISLLRKIYLKFYEHHYWLAMKEILPLMLFPLLYSLVFFGRMKPGPDAPKWGFSQQAQPWSKQTVDDYENMETQMPSEEHATHEIEESASMIVSKNSVDSDVVMSVVELVKDTHRMVQKMEGKDEEEKDKFMVGDVDILAIPAKNPIKFCLQAMDILFTRDEMAHGRYKAVRQRGENKPLPPLDPKRVKLIDDAIIKRFGIEYYNKTAPQVKRQANQKCSDILTKRLNK
ncbi:hypothetical protein EMCRGX_G026715 [Ephydatia muelleri]